MLKMPKFAIYGPNGEVNALYCKCCGEQIASTQPRPHGPLGDHRPRFSRHNNYTEIKILLENLSTRIPSYHITNGCRDCLQPNMDADRLQELYLADMLEMNMVPPIGNHAVRVQAIDYSAQGII